MNNKKFLLSLASMLVCNSALVGFSSKAFALDEPAPVRLDNASAQTVCPAVCNRKNQKWTHHWTHKADNSSVCGCGEYSLVKTGAKFKQLTPSEQARFDTFQNAIANRGLNPRDAARELGSADYKRLSGNQYQIRLSQGNRVTFLVEGYTVKILQVGGHT
jgi:Mannan-binding protein